MTKHSKNNTASSVFSYAEYKKLDYGTKRQRLGNESMRAFDACALCLQKARDPVACNKGHLFCKECVYTDLLSQKKNIKAQKAKLEQWKKEVEEERTRAKAEARDRVLKEFEKSQFAFGSATASTSGSLKAGEISASEKSDSRGLKRKLDVSFSPSRVEKLAEEAEEAALKEIKLEQAEALKAKLPDFWLPSLAPTYASKGTPTDLKDVKITTICHGGPDAHEIALKNLTPVSFTYPKGPPPNGVTEADRRDAMCPSCKKTLSNNTIMFLFEACSHVACKTCTETLVKPSMQCVVCDKVLKGNQIVTLSREGTGYAGGGLAETSKKGIAFQG